MNQPEPPWAPSIRAVALALASRKEVRCNLAVLANAVRDFTNRLEINANQFLGRELIPNRPDLLHVETSSACNLKCRFCAYVKKQSPKVSMPDSFFFDCVRQAVDMGFRRFELTPCTEDDFMDRSLFNKLEFLERHPEVQGYEFFTNFTIPKPKAVERLIGLEKLRHMTISVYGHDLDSFVAIAQSTPNVYRRLIANLETLLPLLDRRRFGLEIGFRSTRDVPSDARSDLLQLLERFKAARIPVRTSRVYNNWGDTSPRRMSMASPSTSPARMRPTRRGLASCC